MKYMTWDVTLLGVSNKMVFSLLPLALTCLTVLQYCFIM